MPEYPLTFTSQAVDNHPNASGWLTDEKFPVSIPEEFGGPGNGSSPEDFMGMALSNCFVATFRVYAKLSKLTYDSLSVGVEYVIEPGENKLPQISRAGFAVKFTGSSDPARIERLAKKVSRSCIMINALNCEKTFTFDVA